jgi:hypothetical protein
MTKLHELPAVAVTQPAENNEVTDALFEILQATGLRPSRLVQVEGDETVVKARVAFQTAPAAADVERACALLGRFSEGPVGWVDSDGAHVLTLARQAPQDELDVLGIASREDSYTSLLAQGFRHERQLLHLFLRHVQADAGAGDWRVAVRPVVPRVSADESEEHRSRTKDVPDLVLSSASARTIVVVENKVEAAEGEGQSDAYSCPRFLDCLARQLAMGNGELTYKLIFLTPDGLAPLQSPHMKHRFAVMSYAELAPMLPEDRADPLGRLLATLRRRVREQATWSRPSDSADVRSYLRVGWGLVTPLRRLRLLCDALGAKDFGTLTRTGASNNANGPVYYAQFLRPEWERGSSSAADEGWSIHLELQWAPRPGTLTLHLHHETCPYRKYKELEQLGPPYEAHQALGNQLRETLADARAPLNRAGWKLRRYKWSHASHRIRDGITVGEMRDVLGHLVSAARPVIDLGVAQLQGAAPA